jgi:hypothetical protein
MNMLCAISFGFGWSTVKYYSKNSIVCLWRSPSWDPWWGSLSLFLYPGWKKELMPGRSGFLNVYTNQLQPGPDHCSARLIFLPHWFLGFLHSKMFQISLAHKLPILSSQSCQSLISLCILGQPRRNLSF